MRRNGAWKISLILMAAKMMMMMMVVVTTAAKGRMPPLPLSALGESVEDERREPRRKGQFTNDIWGIGGLKIAKCNNKQYC